MSRQQLANNNSTSTASTGSAKTPVQKKSLLQVLETPLSELIFRHPREVEQLPERDVDPEQSKQQLFEPLVRPRNQSDVERSKRLDELKASASTTECIRTAFRWAWRAGPSLVVAKMVNSVVTASLPYTTGFAGAETIDALVGLSGDPNMLRSAVGWYIGSASLFLVGQVSSLIAQTGRGASWKADHS